MTSYIDYFVQLLEEAVIEGIPRCLTSIEGNWLEGYRLQTSDGVEMMDGRRFADNIPPHV